jgi:hypothetical protein
MRASTAARCSHQPKIPQSLGHCGFWGLVLQYVCARVSPLGHFGFWGLVLQYVCVPCWSPGWPGLDFDRCLFELSLKEYHFGALAG